MAKHMQMYKSLNYNKYYNLEMQNNTWKKFFINA